MADVFFCTTPSPIPVQMSQKLQHRTISPLSNDILGHTLQNKHLLAAWYSKCPFGGPESRLP